MLGPQKSEILLLTLRFRRKFTAWCDKHSDIAPELVHKQNKTKVKKKRGRGGARKRRDTYASGGERPAQPSSASSLPLPLCCHSYCPCCSFQLLGKHQITGMWKTVNGKLQWVAYSVVLYRFPTLVLQLLQHRLANGVDRNPFPLTLVFYARISTGY